jgi:magnesium transporter
MPKPSNRRSNPVTADVNAADAEAMADPASVIVDWAYYQDGQRHPQVQTLPEALRLARAGDGFVWIGMLEPSQRQLDYVAAEFRLHPLAVEDAVHAHQRPKLERYDDLLFTVVKTIRYVEHDQLPSGTDANAVVETGEVMVFTGPDYVVTVRHGQHNPLAAVRSRLEANPQQLALGPSAVLHAVLDLVVDNYLEVVQAVGNDVDELEIRVFSPRGQREVERVYLLKREVLQIKRAVAPLAGPLQLLADRPLPLLHPDTREYFRDVEDHLTRVRDTIAGFDELLSSILSASLAQLSVTDNEDMRRISAWVAIVAVPTAIAGIYGMNFVGIPALHARWGFGACLGLMALICVILYVLFKRNRWL